MHKPTAVHYEKKGDGFVSVETTSTGGEIERPLEIPEGGEMITNGSGDLLLVVDKEEYAKTRELDSHVPFITEQLNDHGYVNREYSEETVDSINEDEMREARQKMRRIEAYKDLAFKTFALKKSVSPTLKEVRITDEKFQDLHKEYVAVSATFKDHGDYVAYAEDGYFVPWSTYAHKLIRSNGEALRMRVKGEVGMMGPQIVVLQEGYGTGNRFAVDVDLKK